LTASTFSAEKKPLSEDEIQMKVREISKSLRCAVCQSESVWESGSELASQMREIVRERVISGESGDEIRAYFVSRYGDFILLKPRVSGINYLIWFGPFILLVISAFFLYRKMKGWTNEVHMVNPSEIAPIDEKGKKKIEEALQSFREKSS
jgi:cytochrome c-type biogenesis protein CcmH